MVNQSSVTLRLDAVQLNISLAELHEHLVGVLVDDGWVHPRVPPHLLAVAHGAHDGGGHKLLHLVEAVDQVAEADIAGAATAQGLGNVLAGQVGGGFAEQVHLAHVLGG